MRHFSYFGLMKLAAGPIDGRATGAGGRDPRLIGGLGGAAAGGLIGALIDRKKRWRGALLGALGGGAAGFGLGAQHRYLQNKSQLDAQSRAEMERNNARDARLARRGEIAARLAEKGITGVTPYGDSDVDIDDYEARANAEIARRASILTGLSVVDIEMLGDRGRELLFRAHPEIERAFSKGHAASEAAWNRAKESNRFEKGEDWDQVYGDAIRLKRSPLSSFVD